MTPRLWLPGFVIGRHATEHPELVAMEVRAGDEVANHT
jgi:peptidoglycan/xylan/chitin deacetylase (PgdA/CDA1 family)